jgi:hypothetical protein
VVGLSQGVNQGEKALGQLIGLTLGHLIGLHGDQGIVPAFSLDGDSDPADGAGELPATRLLLHWGERRAKEACSGLENLIGRHAGAMEVLHGATLRERFTCS